MNPHPGMDMTVGGVIVGSAIVKQVELHPQNPARAVRAFTAPLITAVKASLRP